MSPAEINHLRRLLGWVRCEIGPTTEELHGVVRSIAPAIGPDPTDFAKEALVKMDDKARNVPKYVRDAIKALEKRVGHEDIGDAEPSLRKLPEGMDGGGNS